MSIPRVALFADCFHEVNGVARTCREFYAFSRRRAWPLLTVVSRPANPRECSEDAHLIELPGSLLSFALDSDLRFDLLFRRHRPRVRAALDAFQPDLVHITGPGHLGILGAMLAHERRIPLFASWHTNLHEYAGCRLARLLPRWAGILRARAGAWAERKALDLTLLFYRLARCTFAPNPELVEMLAARIGRPSFVMPRGIDVTRFSPLFRTRSDATFLIGYVGRLTAEKNVRLLARMEAALCAEGVRDYRFLIVGQGNERAWLEANLLRAEFPGVLKGDDLARAYAGLDAFVFPSETDTFGNVVQESFASGVPVIVSGKGGPRFLVRHGENGFVAASDADFSRTLLMLYHDRELLARLRRNAWASAQDRTWDAVFEGVYRGYAACPTGLDAPVPAPCAGQSLTTAA